MEFRQGTEKDIEKLAQLYEDVTLHLEQNINYPGWKNGVYPIRQDAINAMKEGTLFVATEDEVIYGTMILNHKQEKGYFEAKWSIDASEDQVLIIHTFMVGLNQLRIGIGKGLLKYAEQFGRKQNMKTIRLDVYEKNIPAIQLYENCGYQYVDTVSLGLESWGLYWFRLYELIL